MDTQIILTFLIYSSIAFILTYYFNLFISKEEYTRQDFSDILPKLGNMLTKISSNYPLLNLSGIILISAILAIIILSIFNNWIINSALLPLLLYFFGPRLATYFEETRVTITDNYKDILEIIYARYYRYIMAGFFMGFGTKLIDNWVNAGLMSFYWFIINFFINTALLVLILREDIFEK